MGAPSLRQELRDAAPDLGVVVAFGSFLPRALRELPSLGYLINGHASLLPRHRGAAPIARAILAGDRETGVSVMRVEREMDAGPVALARRIRIGEEETAGELEERLAALTAQAIAEAVEAIAQGSVRWTPQDERAATQAPKLTPQETWLDLREPAERLARRIRALAPRPGARVQLGGETLRLLGAYAQAEPAATGSMPAPGTLRRGADPPLRIATGSGWLVPTRIQRPGGRVLPVAEFLRGHRLPEGARLARPPGGER